MAQRSLRIPVRYGLTVAHVASIEDAAALMRSLQQTAEHPHTSANDPSCAVLDIACTASRSALCSLVKSFPLKGKARKNLGTALRARCVRDSLVDATTAAGDYLLTELQYISNAADAARHLTRPSIDCAIEALSKLESASVQMVDDLSHADTESTGIDSQDDDADSSTVVATTDDEFKSGDSATHGDDRCPSVAPSNVTDFIGYVHEFLQSKPEGLPVVTFKDDYERYFMHKFEIHRFLVDSKKGLVSTFQRIPHIAKVYQDGDGQVRICSALPVGTSRLQMLEADKIVRDRIAKKNAVAKLKCK